MLKAFLMGHIVWLLCIGFILLCAIRAVRIVPRSKRFIVERFGRLRLVLTPGVHFIVPFLDTVAHKVCVLERQMSSHAQGAITADNVSMHVTVSVFYRILDPEKAVYRIRDLDGAIEAIIANVMRSEIGALKLNAVHSSRSRLIETIKTGLADHVEEWGVQIMRIENFDITRCDTEN